MSEHSKEEARAVTTQPLVGGIYLRRAGSSQRGSILPFSSASECRRILSFLSMSPTPCPMKMWSCHFQADSVRTWGLWKAAILHKSVGVRLRSLILLCFPSLPTGRGLTLAGCSSPPRAPHPPPADSTLSDEPAKCCSYLLDSAFWRGTPCPCIPPITLVSKFIADGYC